MKFARAAIIFAAIFVSTFTVARWAHADDKNTSLRKMPEIKIVRDHAPLLETPDAKAKVVEEINMGAPVALTGKRTKGFVEIKTATKTGWASIKDVKLKRKKFDSVEYDENFNPPSSIASFHFWYIKSNGDDSGKGTGYAAAWAPRYHSEGRFWFVGSLGAALFQGTNSIFALGNLEAYLEYQIQRFSVDLGGGLQALVGPGGGVGPAAGGFITYRLPGPFYHITLLGGYEAAKFPGMSKPTSEFKAGVAVQL